MKHVKNIIKYILILCIVYYTYKYLFLTVGIRSPIDTFLIGQTGIMWILFPVSAIIYIYITRFSIISIYTLLNCVFLNYNRSQMSYNLLNEQPMIDNPHLNFIIFISMQIVNVILLMTNKYNYSFVISAYEKIKRLKSSFFK